jgi:hypothetical protein
MMRSKLALVVAATCALALAVAAPALIAAGAKTTTVAATLKGNAEVPGPGDRNGKGDFTAKLKPAKKKVCFTLEVSKLDPMVAAHIHKGASDVAGPIKITLFEDSAGVPGTGNYEGCVKKVKKKLLKKIAAAPEKYYANVHTTEFPDGAIRGQLEAVVEATRAG